MADKYSTIQQHQPLRVPASFDKQGRALIVQLDEIFDDIYRRFGRLRMEDMGKTFQQRIKDDEGATAELQVGLGEIDLSVQGIDGVLTELGMTEDGIELTGGKYIRIKSGDTTALLLDEDGIDMQTAGKVKIHAQDASGSSIIFGTDVDTAKFVVDENGAMKAESVDAGTLSVNGNQVPQIVVSENRPDGTGIVWVKPSSSTSKEWTYSPGSSEKGLDEGQDGSYWYRNYRVRYAAADYLAGDLMYGITVKFYVFSLSSPTNITFRAKLQNGSSWIDIGSVTQMAYSAGTTITLNAMMNTVAANVMNSVSDDDFVVRLETDYDRNKCQIASSIALKAKNTSASGVSACSVYYIN